MRASRVLWALGPIDLKSVVRDPMMRWLVFYPLLMAVAVRWGIPPVNAYAQRRFEVDLTPHFPLLMAFLLLSTPAIAGMVIGFLLLDQRDDRTLSALLVTPLPAATYLAYRIMVPMAVATAVTLVVFPLAGLMRVGFWPLLATAVCAAPLAPFYALTLAAFATNKVEGFALTKAMGVLMIPPVAAWFFASPWHWLCGLTPLFWPAKTLWMLDRGDPFWWAAFLFGLAFQGLLMAALLRRYERVARQG